MDILNLWLIRHGETDWNDERRIQGQSDNGLSARGVRQAQRLGARLADTRFDHLFCSDLARTRQTAEIAFPQRCFTFDARLREIGRGMLEGKTEAEMTLEEKSVYEAMRRDRLHVRPNGGENFEDVRVRVDLWLDAAPKRGRVLVVTHGGIIHTFLRRMLDHADARDFATENTGITELVLGKAHSFIQRVNDCAHLEGQDELRPSAAPSNG